MKRWIVWTALLLGLWVPAGTTAQTAAVEALFLRYGAREEVRSVLFERAMMRLMSARARQSGDEELAKLLEEIHFIRTLVAPAPTAAASAGEADAASERLPGLAGEAERIVQQERGFKPVATTRIDGQQTQVYLRTSRVREEKELLVIVRNRDAETVMHLYGSFDLQAVSRISSIAPVPPAEPEHRERRIRPVP